jgi:hypothetical protein
MSDTTSGLDTYLACSDAMISCFRSNNITFIGRYYYNLTETIKEKFTATEAQRICAAGIQCVALYENKSNTVGYFTSAKGTSDAQGALSQAQALGQPAGTAIYFTVDCDLTNAEVSANVVPYFQAVHAVIGTKYAIGVYGSGYTCATMLDQGLAKYAWLTCSSGWNGSKTFTRWSVKQSDAKTICGVDVDPDIALADFGQFTIASAASVPTTASP